MCTYRCHVNIYRIVTLESVESSRFFLYVEPQISCILNQAKYSCHMFQRNIFIFQAAESHDPKLISKSKFEFLKKKQEGFCRLRFEMFYAVSIERRLIITNM